MLMLLSPAKSLDYESEVLAVKTSRPRWMAESAKLVERLRDLQPEELSSLMGISEGLAVLNHERYKIWRDKPRASQVRAAIFAFDGDVYDGLRAREFNEEQIGWAQDHVRILSGLYGVLRPLDQLQAYRLEMGNSSKLVVNLASEEYFSAVQEKNLKAKVLHIVFQESKGESFKVVSFSAKRARGAMCRWAIENRVESIEALKTFDRDGYQYCPDASDSMRWVFRRKLDAR
ncbi:MAG: peroxide stress protein YaaA [Betaproteobacteria bacterium]|nr:peroxide stress protein YaaA [Betaproteobacteria bacterium]